MDNFDLKKYLAEGRLFKEEMGTNYSIKMLVPKIYFNVETGELSDSPYDFATQDELESGEADVTSYTDGKELNMVVFDGDYDQAKRFEKEYPNLFRVV